MVINRSTSNSCYPGTLEADAALTLFQAAALCFFTRALFPAALGLFLVPALSGLTESFFQSVFAVQLYMLLVFLVSGELLPTRNGEGQSRPRKLR